jgi:hypothetical protein
MHRYIQILTAIQVIRTKLQVSHGGQGKAYSLILAFGLGIGRVVAKTGSSIDIVPSSSRIKRPAYPG